MSFKLGLEHGSDLRFSNINSMYIIGERSDAEKKIIIRQESVNTGQTDAGQSDSYVPLFFAGDTIKATFGPLSYPSNIHTRHHLQQLPPPPLNLRMNTET